MLLDRGTGRVGYLINYIKSYNKKTSEVTRYLSKLYWF